MKIAEIRDQSVEELTVRLEESQKKIYAMRNERRETGKLEKPHEMQATRKTIARILTVMKEKGANV